MNTKKQRTLAIWALVVALCATSVAFAALQTTLTVSGNVTKKGGSWNIHLANVANVTTTGKTTFTKQPTISGTTVNFAANLFQPNDSFSFDVDLVNSGTVAAFSNNVYFRFDDDSVYSLADWSATSNDITCTVFYNGAAIHCNGPEAQCPQLDLAPAQTKKVTIKCMYDNVSSVSATDKTMNFMASFDYSQA